MGRWGAAPAGDFKTRGMIPHLGGNNPEMTLRWGDTGGPQGVLNLVYLVYVGVSGGLWGVSGGLWWSLLGVSGDLWWFLWGVSGGLSGAPAV